MGPLRILGSALTVASIVFLCFAALPLAADDIYVTITSDTDDGFCGGPLHFPCSLRDAILSANTRPGYDAIHVPAGTYNLTIGGSGEDSAMTGDLDITDIVNIIGSGAGVTVIDGLGNDRVFQVLHENSTYFHDLTIRGGRADTGGGIAVQYDGWVLVDRCIIENNVGTMQDWGGGGIFVSNGTLYVNQSTFRGNEAAFGSAIFTYVSSDLIIKRSTFSHNSARNYPDFPYAGGAVVTASVSTEIINSTFTQNTNQLTGRAGGLMVYQGSTVVDACTFADNDGYEILNDGQDLLQLGNTIIRGTCGGSAISTQEGNVEGPGNTCLLLEPGDHYGASLHLLPLGDYGGPTFTMPPEYRPDNVVIDNPRAHPNCQSFDQRGVVRPQNGDNDHIATCDTGAVEVLSQGLIFSDGFESGSTGAWDSTEPG